MLDAGSISMEYMVFQFCEGIPMKSTMQEVLIADRVWIATALLQQQQPFREDFTRDEIRHRLKLEGLTEGVKDGTINAHLKEHCVANVRPSSGKYRMLFETAPGKLRLFRPIDWTDPSRLQTRKPSKSVPQREQIPPKYRPLLDWYATWSSTPNPSGSANSNTPSSAVPSYDDDPLIRLIGSGRHIWADEHADEYVENLRREDI